ncbi:hypothetical protein H9Q09_01200 [Aurantimonas sp. DM33-3]|uniref:hypothetical protein n=1 Tax=Aurantimonas sp. DM33-3 TaxID=2766955 RepID=UPI001652A172|nr:hypothetical protein [Aurantimonas sp. DM33-3]MBC6714801.1 hypothetical protein [Aurantimonas sp. DM33-3]
MDHCTGWFEGWWGELCCKPHDGDYAAQVERLVADAGLWSCVWHSLPEIAAAHPIITGVCAGISAVIGTIMFVGVRLFGLPFYKRAGRK